MKRLLLAAILLSSMACNAQVNPKNGYIITNNQDTIYGMIDYRINDVNSKQCFFKAEDSQEYILYKPNEISGYRFSDNGQYYVSRNFNKEGWYFYEFIVNGILNLYSRDIGTDKTFYIENEKTGNVIVYEEDKNTFQRDLDLINRQARLKAQTLLAEISESRQARNDLIIGSMNERKMIELVKDYHDEMNTSSDNYIVFKTDKSMEQKHWRYSLSAGAGYGWWSSNYNIGYNMSGISYTIGWCSEYSNHRWTKKQTIQFSLMLTHCEANSKENALPENFLHRKLKYDINVLAFGMGPKMVFGKENKPSFILRCGYMPTFIYGKAKTKRFNDIYDIKTLGAYAGVGVEIPMNKHALLINADYRCAYNSHYLLGTVGFRF